MTGNGGYPPPYGPPGHFGLPPGYPYTPYTTPPTQPTNRRWPWIVGAIATAVVLTVGTVTALVFIGGDDEEEVATVTVLYELTGPPVEVQMTYWTSDDARSEVQTVTLPWQTQVTKGGDNNYVSISAMRAERSDEPLGCRISVEGVTISERQAATSTITCGGRVNGQS